MMWRLLVLDPDNESMSTRKRHKIVDCLAKAHDPSCDALPEAQ
jgi:hypothetical protein